MAGGMSENGSVVELWSAACRGGFDDAEADAVVGAGPSKWVAPLLHGVDASAIGVPLLVETDEKNVDGVW